MGILLVSLLVLVSGVVLYNVLDYEEVLETLLWVVSIISGIILSVALLIMVIVQLNCISYPVEHNVYIEYLESIKNNAQITDLERTKAVSSIRERNSFVLNNKKFNDNFWLSIFYPKYISDLKLIDISIVPNAKYQIGIDK